VDSAGLATEPTQRTGASTQETGVRGKRRGGGGRAGDGARASGLHACRRR
jgi:hypothetical protein